MASIVFGNPSNPITPDRAIVHDNENFAVQWSAFNISSQDVPSFRDRLVVTSIPEGCPGSDDQEHEIIFDSDIDGNVNEYTEPALAAGVAGPLMHPTIGPFPVGSYRLTVTLANNVGTGMTTFNCIEIVSAM
jgi:hypothetical protein